MSDWLELELTHHLAPGRAPDELWERLHRKPLRSPRRMVLLRFPALPVAAVVTLILAGALWFMARGEQPRPALRQFPTTANAESCLLCHTSL